MEPERAASSGSQWAPLGPERPPAPDLTGHCTVLPRVPERMSEKMPEGMPEMDVGQNGRPRGPQMLV